MNKIESRHRLIRSIISERRIHTQQELQEALEANGVLVTQSTLSRDVKSLNLVKINEGDSSYYAMNTIAPSRWEKRLRMYMEDALVMLRPVQNQVVVKTLPGLAQSFGAILDALELQEIVATICGDDVCLVICEDNQGALDCFEKLKEFTPCCNFKRFGLRYHNFYYIAGISFSIFTYNDSVSCHIALLNQFLNCRTRHIRQLRLQPFVQSLSRFFLL